ncbi:hypothetical protein ACTFIV_000853 [Dictyostelium citrinum]
MFVIVDIKNKNNNNINNNNNNININININNNYNNNYNNNNNSFKIVVDWLSTVYLLCSNQLVSLTIVIRVQHEDVEYTKALKDYNVHPIATLSLPLSSLPQLPITIQSQQKYKKNKNNLIQKNIILNCTGQFID